MKTLIIYYSLTGNTKFIAETMAKKINADLLELFPEKNVKTEGFMKYVWGGRQVMMKIAPKLLPFDKNPNDYDFIIIGTPVWAWNFAPALRSFFIQTKLKNKKVALFCCHGGQMGKTLDNMKRELAGNEILGAIDFFEPLKNNPSECLKRVTEWIKNLSL